MIIVEGSMKRLWLVTLAAALCLAAGSLYAEVQNIRVLGEVRVRGFYVNNLDLTEDARDLPGISILDEATGETITRQPDAKDEDAFVRQRTRITVEADLEDQVLAVATIQADGAWGSDRPGEFPVTDDFDASLAEAYVQLQEMWYTPATLKLGRQYLHYGRGLILSSKEYELRYDAARLVWDRYPFTLDLVFGKIYEGFQSLRDNVTAGQDENLWFANLRYEFEESPIQDIELYLGYRDQQTDSGASPGIVGLRGDIAPSAEWTAWAEAGYAFGDAADGEDLKAYVFDLGTEYIFTKTALEPKLTFSWTYASGGRAERTFVPWGDYNLWGYVFSPALSNIHILNAAVEVLPVENLSLGVGFYYYLQDSASAGVVGSPYKDNGGVRAVTNGTDRNLGAEIDFVVGYDYSNDVRTKFYVGTFLPGDAYKGTTGDDEAVEVRGEIQVNF